MAQPTTQELLARIDTLVQRVETLETRQRTRTPRRARVALGVLALAALLAVPVGVFANHSFTDVPNSHQFHTVIGLVEGAGITSGCSPTTYCPSAPVTRGQMAAFLTRTGGRAASDHIPATNMADNASGIVLASLTLKPGGVAGGTAHVKVDASITAYTFVVDGCPCGGSFRLRVNGVLGEIHQTGIDDYNFNSIVAGDSTSITSLFTVPTGVATTVELIGANAAGDEVISVFGDVVATYFPFAGDGSNP